MKNEIPLPAPVLESDVYDYRKGPSEDYYSEPYDAPTYTQYGGTVEFELWYTERFGWCIPTLTIRGISKRARARGAETRRSYAVAIKGETLVSCGMGPHVKRHVTVRVKKSRYEALKPLLDLMLRGAEKAGDCRDRRSSRIAQTRERNLLRGGSWF